MREKFKRLSRREKAEYIWDYYRLHILGLVMALVLAGSLIQHFILNPPKPPFLQVAFYGNFIDGEFTEGVAWRLTQALKPADQEQVYAYAFFIGPEDNQLKMGYAQKFAAMIAAKELDLLVINNQEDFPYLAGEDFFLDLGEVLDEKTLGRLAKEGLLVYENSAPYGLRLEGNALFAAGGNYADDAYLCLISNSQKPDRAKEAFRYLAGQSSPIAGD